MRTGSRRHGPYRRYELVGGIAGPLLALILVSVLDIPAYPTWIVALSVATFALYGFDKRQAIAKRGRVPELVLHVFALAGGFPGGWSGRWAFKHKTRHAAFLLVLLCATAIHLAIAWRLYG